MAETEVHKRKKSKNRTLLALILGWCLLIWLITMVRMAQAEEMPVTPPVIGEIEIPVPDEISEIETETEIQPASARPFDLEHFFAEGRAQHQVIMNENREEILERAGKHQNQIKQNPEKWWPGWQDRLFPADYGAPAE